MNQLIHKLMLILREHVDQNMREIQFNQEEIDKLLSDISLSARKKDLDGKYEINRNLQSENSDFVKLQQELSEFLEKYKHHYPSAAASSIVETEKGDTKSLFSKTVSGEIHYDSSHPQFSNPRFFEELLSYFERNEDYEMCDKLLKIRKL